MDYRNKKHKIPFEEAIRKKDKKNYAVISALYLLTSDSQLWQTVRHYVVNNAISFEQIEPSCVFCNKRVTNTYPYRGKTICAECLKEIIKSQE